MSKNQYYILSYPGSGNMFFLAILSQYLKKIQNNSIMISSAGDCHNYGQGKYKNTDDIELVGWHIDRAINNNKKDIMSGHCTNLLHIKSILPTHKIILIDIPDSFLHTALTMRFYKTMNPMSQKEYNKWVNKYEINHWPTYQEVVEDPELVKDDLLTLGKVWYNEWNAEIDRTQIDYVINCKTVFGLDDLSINCVVANIVGNEIDLTIESFIKKYQSINQTLYINNK